MSLSGYFAKQGQAQLILRERLLDFAWSLRLTAIALGIPGFIGLLLLAGAAWIHWVEEPRAAQTLAALESEVADLKKREVRPAAVLAPTPLEIFREQLEPQSRFSAVLDDVNATLKSANVTLIEAVVTRPKFDALPTIGRIDLSLHARGQYPALKLSLGTLLLHHPGLGLEQLTLEKTESTNPTLDAHARFVYFFHD